MSRLPLHILQHEPDDPPGTIAVALGELGVPFEVRRLDLGDPLPEWPGETAGVISLGGAMHVHQRHEYPFLDAEIRLLRRLVHDGGPAWGICLGAQLLTLAAGGEVYRRREPEAGWTWIEKVRDDPLLRGVPSPFVAFNWHEYSCKLPPHGQLVAARGRGVQAYRAGGRAWATQFHPEVDEAMAPHWVEDMAKEYAHRGDDFIAGLRADTERFLPGYPAFCRTLVRNFVCTAGLLACDPPPARG